MLEFQSVSKFFQKTPALKEINFSVKQGERIALIGPSGSGKTSLLKLINAQHLATKGKVLSKTQDLATLSNKALRQYRSGIATIPQDLGLVPSLKVYANVFLGRIAHHHTLGMLRRVIVPPKREMEEIFQILQRVGIPEKLYHTTSTLSGGQQQRVAVARSLFQKAHTLLADEPVSAVDPVRAESLIELLKEVSEENQLSLLMSIHNIDLATRHFPRLIGLREGEMQFDTNNPSKKDLQALFQLKNQDNIG